MKIAITGTHGTGKTTLLNVLKNDTNLSNIFEFTEEITRSLQKEGYVINENGDDYSQIAISLKHYEICKKFKNLIMDRCLLDVLCYTRYLNIHNKCTEDTLKFVETLFKEIKYDIIFYVEPEFDLVDDGTRSLNIEFRDTVKECFIYYIKKLNIKVIKLTGSIDNRLKVIKKEITDHFNNLLK